MNNVSCRRDMTEILLKKRRKTPFNQSKMGRVRSKTRSLDQMLEKSCVHSRGHFFSLIMIKLGQNDFLNKIINKFENGSCRVKN